MRPMEKPSFGSRLAGAWHCLLGEAVIFNLSATVTVNEDQADKVIGQGGIMVCGGSQIALVAKAAEGHREPVLVWETAHPMSAIAGGSSENLQL